MKSNSDIPKSFKLDLHEKYPYKEVAEENQLVEVFRNWLPNYHKSVNNPLLYHIFSGQANCFVQSYKESNIIVWDEAFWSLYDKFSALVFCYLKLRNDCKDEGELVMLQTECLTSFCFDLFGQLAFRFETITWLRDKLLMYADVFQATERVQMFMNRLDMNTQPFFVFSRYFAIYHELAHIVFKNDSDEYCNIIKEIDRLFSRPDDFYSTLEDEYLLDADTNKNKSSEYVSTHKYLDNLIYTAETNAEVSLKNEIAADYFAMRELKVFTCGLNMFTNEYIAVTLCQIVTMFHKFIILIQTIFKNWNSFIPTIRCPHIKTEHIDHTDIFRNATRSSIGSIGIQSVLLLTLGYSSATIDDFCIKHLDPLEKIDYGFIMNIVANPLTIQKIIDADNDEISIFL